MKNLLFKIITLGLMFNTSAYSSTTSTGKNKPLIRYENSTEIEFQKLKKNPNSKGAPTIASVGNGMECTHSTIQAAIDSGADEVRVVFDHVYEENLTIVADGDLIVRGDFSTCINANNGSVDFAHQRSEINGITGTVINIVAPALKSNKGTTAPKITLYHLEIYGGTASLISAGGGIHMESDVEADVNIWNNSIHNNISFTGGGVGILGAGVISLSSNTTIFNNSAQYGGGVYCSNSATDIVSFDISVTSNTAFKSVGIENGKGGGIFASNGCVVSLHNRPGGAGVSLNQAEGQGGGIYAQSGAKVYLLPIIWCEPGNICTTTAVNLIGNVSDSDNSDNENGGGALITGTNTFLRIHDGNIFGNKAGGHGGAISIEDGARLSTGKSQNCWDNDHCVYFANNKAGELSFGAGGAIFNSSSIAEIDHATFEGNRADFGTVLYGSGLNSLTTINGSIFNHNGDGGGNVGANGFSDNYVLRVVSDAVLHLRSSTIADNNATLSVLGIGSSVTSASSIYSSIIHDTDSGNVFSSSSGYVTDCVMAHETGSFLAVGSSTAVIDPLFIDRGNRDYHIQRFSLAIDYCDNFFGGSDTSDVDLEFRGYDDPSIVNNLGPYDVGADETYETDIIFKHGFE